MKWEAIKQKFNFENVFKTLTLKYLDEFLEEHQTAEIVAFGADCNASYADVFIAVLTKEGVSEVPQWKKDWEWIAEWDFWDLNEGFDNEENYQGLKQLFDQLMYELAQDEFLEIEKEFLFTICRVLSDIQQEYPVLSAAELIIRDHGDMQQESEERIKIATKQS